MLTWFDRLLDLASALVPDALSRFDRLLLVRYPLFWRSRLLWVLCVTLPLAAAAAGVGAAVPMTSRDVWTSREVFHVVGPFSLATLLAAGLWARAQARHPVGYRRPAELVRITGYSLIALVVWFVPLMTFNVSLSTRIAGVITPEALQRQLDYHKAHGFWCCAKLDSAMIARERTKLDASLAELGLSTTGELREMDSDQGESPFAKDRCPGLFQNAHERQEPEPEPEPWACLVVRDSNGEIRTHLLRERLESVYDEQAEVLNEQVAAWRLIGAALFATPWALMLTLFGAPHAWRRRLSGARLLPSALKWRQGGWIPKLLRRLDHQFLINRPVEWVARALVPYCLMLGVPFVGIVLALLGRLWWMELCFALSSLGFSLGCWLLVRRALPIGVVTIGNLRRAIALTVLVNVVTSSMVAWVITGMLTHDLTGSLAVVEIVLVLAPFVFTPALLLSIVAARFKSALSGFAAACIFFLWMIPVSALLASLDMDVTETDRVHLWVIINAGVWITAERLAARHTRNRTFNPATMRLAFSILTLTAPTVFGFAFLLVGRLLLDALGLNVDEFWLVPVGLCVLALYATYRWLLAHTLTILLRLRLAPAVE